MKGKICQIPEPNFYNGFVTWSNLERLLHSLSYNAVDVSDKRPSKLPASLKVCAHLTARNQKYSTTLSSEQLL